MFTGEFTAGAAAFAGEVAAVDGRLVGIFTAALAQAPEGLPVAGQQLPAGG